MTIEPETRSILISSGKCSILYRAARLDSSVVYFDFKISSGNIAIFIDHIDLAWLLLVEESYYPSLPYEVYFKILTCCQENAHIASCHVSRSSLVGNFKTPFLLMMLFSLTTLTSNTLLVLLLGLIDVISVS